MAPDWDKLTKVEQQKNKNFTILIHSCHKHVLLHVLIFVIYLQDFDGKKDALVAEIDCTAEGPNYIQPKTLKINIETHTKYT